MLSLILIAVHKANFRVKFSFNLGKLCFLEQNMKRLFMMYGRIFHTDAPLMGEFCTVVYNSTRHKMNE